MHLLNTYDCKDEADEAAALIKGPVRVASERDDTATVYNLFADASWTNLYNLGMYDLKALKRLLEGRESWGEIERNQHAVIVQGLERVCRKYELCLPSHWL